MMLCVPLLQAAAAADLASLAVEAWHADQRKNQQAAWRCVPVFGPDEIGSFSTPVSVSLDAKNDKATPGQTPQFRST